MTTYRNQLSGARVPKPLRPKDGARIQVVGNRRLVPAEQAQQKRRRG